jgi:hypothetical protein
MIANPPPIPEGSDNEAVFARWARDAILAMARVQDVPGARVNRTTRGTAIIPDARAVATQPVLGPFVLKEVHWDFVRCRSWDGTTEGTKDVYIMKEWKARMSLASETIFGVVHDYSYADGPDEMNVIRTDAAVTPNEQQRIVPPWTLNEIIYAVTAPTLAYDATAELEGFTLTDPADEFAAAPDDNPNYPPASGNMLLMIGRSSQWAKLSS